MSEQETRDMVIEVKTALNSHLTDCVSFRGRIEKSLDGVFTRLAVQDKLQVRQNYIIGAIVGGAFVLNWLVEHSPVVAKFVGH